MMRNDERADQAGARQGKRARLPFHVLTGFLGSGKTELVRSVLARTDERIAVLVNELGELALDHDLVEDLEEDVLALPGGCLCCALRGDLYAAIARVRGSGAERVVLETTGLADPAPILDALECDPELRSTLELGGVAAVVDGVRAEQLFHSHDEVRRQLDLADRIVLTKSDLAPERTESVREWLVHEFPGREVQKAVHGDVELAWLFAPPRFQDRADGRSGASAWLHDSPAQRHCAYTTHAVRHERPIEIAALQLWLRLVTQLDGERVLRVKAVARCAQTGIVHALQSAGRSVSPPQALAGSTSGLAGADVVIIERGLPASVLTGLLASLRSALEGDRLPRG